MNKEEIRQAIEKVVPAARWGTSISIETIQSIEIESGVSVPSSVRFLYQVGDGFREPLGNASYLLPIITDSGSGTVQSVTYSCRRISPRLEGFAVWGLNGGDEFWMSPIKSGNEICLWSPLEPNLIESLGDDVFKVFEEDQIAFDE